jgi:hypothetical protein
MGYRLGGITRCFERNIYHWVHQTDPIKVVSARVNCSAE